MGPLTGFRIIEIAGIGPTQFCGMLLADMGADVVRIVREGDGDAGVGIPPEYNVMNRGRRTLVADLKSDEGRALVFALCDKADALFEGFRPGVMERLGLGPDECLTANGKLVYGRMTGWGQDGPLSEAAGHDGNYAAIAGALGAIGPKGGPPSIPLNLVADFGGGGAYLAIGLLAALLEASRSGQGQVIDAAMVDGSASLMSLFYGLLAGGLWRDQRGSNLLDGGAPFYRAYRTSDDEYIVVCAIEPQFFMELLEKLGIDDIVHAEQHDASQWPRHVDRLESVIAGQSRAHWERIFEGSDACVAPVLSLSDAIEHAHNRARNTFVDIDGVTQPAPAPRFSRTASEIGAPAGTPTVDAADILESWNITP